MTIEKINPIKLGIFALLTLTLGIGISRFIFTPILPILLAQGELDLTQLSHIASINYAGYLIGALVLAVRPHFHPRIFSAACVLSVLCLAFMAFSYSAPG